MKTIYSFLLFLFILFTGFSQDLPLLIEDNFDDNKNAWQVSDDIDASSDIINGYYYLKNKSSVDAFRFWTTFNVDTDREMIVEVRLRQVFGEEDLGYGFFIFSDGVDENYNFEIKSNGYFRSSMKRDGYYDNLKWHKSTLINPKGEYNTIKIKKTSGFLYYYINGKLVNAKKMANVFGNDYGFVLRGKMKIQIDYIKIYGEKEEINLINNPITSPKENLGGNINTKYSELIPVIAPDGDFIYFVRDDYPGNIGTDKDHNDIWFSKYDGNKWTKAKNIDRPLNNLGHNFVIAVTPDNNTLILNGNYTAFGEEGGNGISMSTRNNDGSWSIPKNIDINNFYNDDLYQNFTVSPDLQTIIMSVERSDDTYGESDLYVSFRKDDGTYTEPANIGNTINTDGEEGTPFLAADNRTLYFYSDGHPGFGSADIFVSKREGDSWTKWSEPLNLGSNINSKKWDAYFTIDAKGEYAYLVSSADAMGEEDIFRVKVQEELQPNPVVLIYGKVFDENSNEPLSAKISYDDLSTNKQVDVANSNSTTGEYKIILPYGKNYGFFAAKDGYMGLSDNIDLTDIDKYTEMEVNLYLIPLEVNQKIILNNLFFETGKPDILSSSYPELDRLVKTLKTNTDIKIEIQGYTNNIGKKSALVELSLKRAKAVKDYLVEKGISEDRVTTKGFGPANPIADNSTVEGRRRNQRVEFKITDN